MGNPLLDISATVDKDFLDKYVSITEETIIFVFLNCSYFTQTFDKPLPLKVIKALESKFYKICLNFYGISPFQSTVYWKTCILEQTVDVINLLFLSQTASSSYLIFIFGNLTVSTMLACLLILYILFEFFLGFDLFFGFINTFSFVTYNKQMTKK